MPISKIRGMVVGKLPFPATRGILADQPYSHPGLETKALGFRRSLGYRVLDRIKGIDLYDKIQEYRVSVGGKLHRVFCCIETLTDGREAEARFNRDSDAYEIALTVETYGRLEAGHPRGTMSVLHEGAHIVAHAVLLQKLTQLPIDSKAALYSGGKSHSHHSDTEWQADTLASAIAMPAHGIRQLERELQEQGNTLLRMESVIQKHFGVSPEAAAFRWDVFSQKRGLLLRD
jgi:hypothetical protein